VQKEKEFNSYVKRLNKSNQPLKIFDRTTREKELVKYSISEKFPSERF